MSGLDDHRIAALLSEAADPMDPVVPPGRDFTRRAQRRLVLGWARTGLLALTMVLTVGGGGFWIAWQGAEQAPPSAVRQSVLVSGPDGGSAGGLEVGPGLDSSAPTIGTLALPEAGLALIGPMTTELLARAQHLIGQPAEPLTADEAIALAAEMAADACRYNVTRCERPREDMELPFHEGQVTDLTAAGYLNSLEWLWAMPRSTVGAGFEVPETVAEEWGQVSAAEWPGAMVSCLRTHGHPARVTSGLPWVPASARTIELAPDARQCALWSQPPWVWDELSQAQWEGVHVHLSEQWLGCLGLTGRSSDLIGLGDFLEQVEMGRPVAVALVEDLSVSQTLRSECPAMPPDLRASLAAPSS